MLQEVLFLGLARPPELLELGLRHRVGVFDHLDEVVVEDPAGDVQGLDLQLDRLPLEREVAELLRLNHSLLLFQPQFQVFDPFLAVLVLRLLAVRARAYQFFIGRFVFGQLFCDVLEVLVDAFFLLFYRHNKGVDFTP